MFIPILALLLKHLTKLFFWLNSFNSESFLASSEETKSTLFSTKIQGKGRPSKNRAFSSIEFFHFIVLIYAWNIFKDKNFNLKFYSFKEFLFVMSDKITQPCASLQNIFVIHVFLSWPKKWIYNYLNKILPAKSHSCIL